MGNGRGKPDAETKINPMTTLSYSLLSNGNLIAGLFPIGSLIQTQWGPRRVIAHEIHSIKFVCEPYNT